MTHPVVTALQQTAKQLLGSEPTTCPWRSLHVPLVRQVFDVFPLYEKGQASLAIGADPPKRIVDALVLFGQALNVIDADDREKERTKREAARKGAKR